MICYACNRSIPGAGPEPFFICKDCKAGRTAFLLEQDQARWERSFIRYFWTDHVTDLERDALAQKYGPNRQVLA